MWRRRNKKVKFQHKICFIKFLFFYFISTLHQAFTAFLMEKKCWAIRNKKKINISCTYKKKKYLKITSKFFCSNFTIFFFEYCVHGWDQLSRKLRNWTIFYVKHTTIYIEISLIINLSLKRDSENVLKFLRVRILVLRK